MAEALVMNGVPLTNRAAFANEVIERRAHVVRVVLRAQLRRAMVALVEHIERRARAKELVLDSVSFTMEWREDGRAVIHATWKDLHGNRHVQAPKGMHPWG